MNQLLHTKRRHLIVLFAFVALLLGGNNLAIAQIQEEWNSANISGKTYTSSTTVTVKRDVTLTSQIRVNKDVTLTIVTNGAARKITRSFGGTTFYVAVGGTLKIEGASGKEITIDGGSTFNTSYVGQSGFATGGQGPEGTFIEGHGNLILKHVILQNGYGGCIFGGNTSATKYNWLLTDVTIRGFYKTSEGSAMYPCGSDYHYAKLTRVNISGCYCTTNGGTIRTSGSGRTSIVLDACEITNNYSTGSGGGVWFNAGGLDTTKVTIKGNTLIEGNHATSRGGGVIVESKMDIISARILNNSAPYGGGVYLSTYGGNMDAFTGTGYELHVTSDVMIQNNSATVEGGGIYMCINKSADFGYNPSGTPIDANFILEVNGGEISGNHAPVGAGVSINDYAPNRVMYPRNTVTHGASAATDLVTSGLYKRTISITSGSIHDNYTDGGTNCGAGIYIRKYKDSGIAATGSGFTYQNVGGAGEINFTISGGSIYNNGVNSSGTVTTANGGAFYITDEMGSADPYKSKCKITITNTSTDTDIYANKTTAAGGAFYINNGVVEMKGGTIGGSLADANTTSGNGGGFYITGDYSTVSVTGGTLSYNSATGNGGGLYVNPSASATTYINSTESTTNINNNVAVDGAGVYVASGTLEIATAATNIHHNEASGNGGGIYVNNGTTTVTGGNIQYNKATNGGGIYANDGTTTVNYPSEAAGKIQYNYASVKGGGIYIPSGGTLNLYGTSTIEHNRVPYNGFGGGVYLEGIVQAGHVSKSDGDAIKVRNNYADEDGATITNVNRNNIYLPNPTVNADHKDVITVVDGGLDLGNSSIGFSVPDNFVPVIYCDNAGYLNPTIKNSSAIFEDSHSYQKYYTDGTDGYDANHIYLVADTWTFYQKTAPTGFSTTSIDSSEDLAWFISTVNGLNEQSASSYSGETVTLTADIDMSAHKWVPIGDVSHMFAGTFDGGGHTITGIRCNYIKGTGGTGTSLGLFGVTNGATIHDVFLANDSLMVRDQGSGTYYIGGIVGSNNGTIYNCIVASTMESTITSATMGGLVGTHTGGTIHSSAAMPNMSGYTMGGLVGTLTGGTLYNSFANPKFEYDGPNGSTDYFVGGLVAENSGTVQNCYVRFSRPSSLGSAKFGQIVGSTSNANVTVCYNPESYASGISANLVYPESGTVSSTNYGDVVAPYLYNNHDSDNIVYGTSETLCNKLNDWVTTHSGNGYAQWKRTTAGGYSTSPSGGNINGDYPIHEYSGYTCVASTDGINLDYHTSLDNMLARHVSDATINLYANEANVTGSTGTNVVVYIDENISLLQDVSGSKSRTSVIEAYTCQTLPGDPRSWHFISSSLSNSGIGFEYNQYAGFNWEPNPCHVNISENNDASLFPSDLPKVGGFSDVSRIDLYTFYEPEYHWINLKRNSASHWHMNATTTPINYTNETTLTPGKGYLVSIDQDQLLQNRGTLNNGDVEVALGYSSHQEWAGLVGYNLLGNPYQSYLSFTAFVDQNSTLWYDDSKGKAVEPTYAVYDDAMGGYIQYKQGASRGARTASGTLNMHQGFMVRSSGATRAKFTNAMRTNDGTSTGIREEQPAFPLINLTVTDSEGVNDFAVLELGRDADEGAQKLRANDSKGWLYLHHGSDDYGILFRSEVDDYQPLWFETEEAGTYTLSWGTANAEFESLTLVDNITGVTTDMLTNDSYTFEANPDQYSSRFKIVIGDYKDIEENEDGASTGSAASTFAYYANGEIHLVETQNFASLQIVDVTGRVILSRDASQASAISTTGMAPGVYVLRLTNGKGTKIQKMVIE